MKNIIQKTLFLAASMGFFFSCYVHADSTLSNFQTMQAQLSSLEKSANGRIGVYALNTENNSILQYRATERFPMCCTAKVVLVGAILKKSMTDKNLLNERIFYSKADLDSWSPVTKNHVADGMTIKDLCAAAISYSDNTAAILLVNKLGGVQAVDVFARSIGDSTFNLTHDFPREAASIPGDVNDTTTPQAMAQTYQKLVLGNVLADPERNLLVTWMKETVTGINRIHAGIPADWIEADKTGTGSGYGTTNDAAILWPPKHAPIILVVYFTQHDKNANKREDLIASATRIVVNTMK